MVSQTKANQGQQARQATPVAPPAKTRASYTKGRVKKEATFEEGGLGVASPPSTAGKRVTVTGYRGKVTVHPVRTSARTRAARPAWAPDERTGRLIEMFGNKGLADLLGVSQSQPSRWKTGEEVPGPAVAPRLVDLDHVVARLLLLWDQSVVLDWLKGSNGFLEGARPIDVIATRGTNEVIDAIEAQASGAYA